MIMKEKFNQFFGKHKRSQQAKHGRWAIPILILSLSMVVSSCGSLTENAIKTENEPLGTASFEDGRMVALSDYEGKKVYIKFWATWCSICLAGLDKFEAFSDEMAANGDVIVLSIVSPGANGEMSTEDFKDWYERQGYTFPVLLDEGGVTARAFGIRGYPTSVFIDADGRVMETRPGHMENDDILAKLEER